MYCPSCFNNSLALSSHGVIHIEINNKKKDAARILFSQKKHDYQEMLKRLEQKLDEFFKWLSEFENREPIEKLEVFTSDFTCLNKCAIPINTRFSVVGSMVKTKDFFSIIVKLGEQYNLEIKVREDSY